MASQACLSRSASPVAFSTTACKPQFLGEPLRVVRGASHALNRQPARLPAVKAALDRNDVQKALHLLQPTALSEKDASTNLATWRAKMFEEVLRMSGGKYSPSQLVAAVKKVEEESFADKVAVPNADYSVRDKDAACTFYVLLWKRRTLPQQLFDDFWRNVHGPVCARIPGQHQYWQYHVDHSEGGIFQVAPGVEILTEFEDQFDGIAELTFRSEADRRTWFDGSGILMDDEHNIFSKAIGYVTNIGNSATLKDLRREPAANEATRYPRFHVLIRKNDLVSVAEFRKYVQDLAGLAYASQQTTKVRVHLFEDIETNRPDAAGVAHGEDPERVYHAALELAFDTRLDAELFFVSKEYKQAMEKMAKYIKAVLPMPENACYTFVYNDQMTLAGIRGSQIVQNIVDCGAVNQLQDDVMQLMIKGWVGN